MKKVIFAPHLDDEIIGCFSILNKIDRIVYFTKDYREESILREKKYVYEKDFNYKFSKKDILYLPSKYDYHPRHKEVRNTGLRIDCEKMFYSVEMNVPWLKEEKYPKEKKKLFKKLYPKENLQNDKYWLFKSIKSFDDIIFSTIRFDFVNFHRWENAPKEVSFLKNLHRHRFYLEVAVQQFHNERDLEYFKLIKKVKGIKKEILWTENTSCESFALQLKRRLEVEFFPRIIQVNLFEDNENGVKII